MLNTVKTILKSDKYNIYIKFSKSYSDGLVLKEENSNYISYIINYKESYELSKDREYLYYFVLDNMHKALDAGIKKFRDDYIYSLVDLSEVNNMSLFLNFASIVYQKMFKELETPLIPDLGSMDIYVPFEDKYTNLIDLDINKKDEIKKDEDNTKQYSFYNHKKSDLDKTKKEIEEFDKLIDELNELLDDDGLIQKIDKDEYHYYKMKQLLGANLQKSYEKSPFDKKLDKKYEEMMKEMRIKEKTEAKLGDYLDELLKARHMSQKDLAFKIGVDPSLISKVVGHKQVDSYTTDRATLIMLAFGLELTLKETIELFKLGGFVLRERVTWDNIVLFVLKNAEAGEFEYDINILNTYLTRFGYNPIAPTNYEKGN